MAPARVYSSVLTLSSILGSGLCLEFGFTFYLGLDLGPALDLTVDLDRGASDLRFGLGLDLGLELGPALDLTVDLDRGARPSTRSDFRFGLDLALGFGLGPDL